MGGAAVELVLEFVAQLRRRRVRRGRSGSGSKAGPIVGTLPFSPSSRSSILCASSIFSSGSTVESRTTAVPASIASRRCCGDVGGEDRGQHQQADHDPRVAGGDRPAAVDRLRRAPAERGLGQRREHQREADADQDLRRQRQRHLGLGQQRQAAEAAGDEDRAGGRPRPGAGHQRAEAAAEQGRERHHRDHDRGPDRGQPPAFDQQQDEQEERRGDRRRDHRQRDVGGQVRAAGPAQLGPRIPVAASCLATARIGTAAASASGTWIRKIDCQETSSVSRPPTAGPSAAPVAPALGPDGGRAALGADRRRQQLERRGDRGGAAEGLDAAGERSGSRAGRRAPQARPAPAKTASPTAAARPGRRGGPASAAGTAASAITRLKETSTQVTPATLVSSSR